jgi:hypothetical protein
LIGVSSIWIRQENLQMVNWFLGLSRISSDADSKVQENIKTFNRDGKLSDYNVYMKLLYISYSNKSGKKFIKTIIGWSPTRVLNDIQSDLSSQSESSSKSKDDFAKI